MAKSYIEKMEEAAGISPSSAETSIRMPYGKGEYLKSGEVARPWTGPRPWRDKGIPLIPRAKGGPVSPGRPKVMKMKGMPLAGFMPLPKKVKRGKKRVAM